MIRRSSPAGSQEALGGASWNRAQAVTSKEQPSMFVRSLQNYTIPSLPANATAEEALRFEAKLMEFQLKYEVARAAIEIFGQTQSQAFL